MWHIHYDAKMTAISKRIVLLLMACCFVCEAYAADDDFWNIIGTEYNNEIRKRYVLDVSGDTVLEVIVPPVVVFSRHKSRSRRSTQRSYREYYRMIYNLKTVYPYVQFIKYKLAEMDADFVKLKTDRERKAYVKRVEKQLFAEFEPHVRKMTVSQGRMLIKLVNRETGKTGYALIKELRGSLSAFFWQTVATMFNSSLKIEFDAENDDKVLNELIFLYENGWL
jgi:hypothetical protein